MRTIRPRAAEGVLPNATNDPGVDMPSAHDPDRAPQRRLPEHAARAEARVVPERAGPVGSRGPPAVHVGAASLYTDSDAQVRNTMRARHRLDGRRAATNAGSTLRAADWSANTGASHGAGAKPSRATASPSSPCAARSTGTTRGRGGGTTRPARRRRSPPQPGAVPWATSRPTTSPRPSRTAPTTRRPLRRCRRTRSNPHVGRSLPEHRTRSGQPSPDPAPDPALRPRRQPAHRKRPAAVRGAPSGAAPPGARCRPSARRRRSLGRGRVRRISFCECGSGVGPPRATGIPGIGPGGIPAGRVARSPAQPSRQYARRWPGTDPGGRVGGAAPSAAGWAACPVAAARAPGPSTAAWAVRPGWRDRRARFRPAPTRRHQKPPGGAVGGALRPHPARGAGRFGGGLAGGGPARRLAGRRRDAPRIRSPA
jgi:hypothetical protein